MHDIDDTPPILDYGTIRGNFSLVTDKFPEPIPQRDYMVCRSLTWGAVGSAFTGTSVAGDPSHSHNVQVNERFRGLRPGDRVLVVWLGKWPEADACVVDIVLPATELG